MQKFRFALEPVLDQRRRIEEAKQQTLAQRMQEVHAAEEALRGLNGRYKEHSTALRERHQGMATEDLRLHYAHLEYLDRAITTQHAVLGQRKAAAERARLELVEASKERQVIEKLKERKHAEFVANAGRLEQNELDDSNARRFARRGLQGGFA
jgi:flagellar FliJ protein